MRSASGWNFLYVCKRVSGSVVAVHMVNCNTGIFSYSVFKQAADLSSMDVPEQFLNKNFREVRQENLGDFLAIRGVPWLIRKLIQGKMKNGVFHLTKNGNKYHIETGEASKNLTYDFQLGEKFKAIGYDGKEHEITYSVEGGRLKEVHLNLSRPETGEDVFYYEVRDGVLHSECLASDGNKTVIWRREYERK